MDARRAGRPIPTRPAQPGGDRQRLSSQHRPGPICRHAASARHHQLLAHLARFPARRSISRSRSKLVVVQRARAGRGEPIHSLLVGWWSVGRRPAEEEDDDEEPGRGEKRQSERRRPPKQQQQHAAWGSAGGGAGDRRRRRPLRAPGAAARGLHRAGDLQRLRAPALRHRRAAARRGRRPRHAHLLHPGDGGSGRAKPQRSQPQGVLALVGH